MVKWLVGLLAAIGGLIALYWKGILKGRYDEQMRKKSEALDEMVKVNKDIKDHLDDPIDDVRKRLSDDERSS